MTAAASSPEPQAPDSLVQLQQQIAEAQRNWTNAEDRWNTARDSLRKLSDETERMQRAGQRNSAQYRLLFADFSDQEQRERVANREREAAFSRYTGLQSRYSNAVQEFRAQRESWGDETFTDFADIRLARLQALNREEVWDTTNANGVSQVSLEKGQWWVHARYELPYSELYWNEPIEVTGGDPMQVLLNRSTAEARPRF
jgi:chromosome segregation ATPase